MFQKADGGINWLIVAFASCSAVGVLFLLFLAAASFPLLRRLFPVLLDPDLDPLDWRRYVDSRIYRRILSLIDTVVGGRVREIECEGCFGEQPTEEIGPRRRILADLLALVLWVTDLPAVILRQRLPVPRLGVRRFVEWRKVFETEFGTEGMRCPIVFRRGKLVLRASSLIADCAGWEFTVPPAVIRLLWLSEPLEEMCALHDADEKLPGSTPSTRSLLTIVSEADGPPMTARETFAGYIAS